MNIEEKDFSRFMSKVDVSDNCWEWTGAVRKGYGLFRYKNRIWSSHRFSWYVHNGETDRLVCHECDNRVCVRIEHLFLGTHQVNTDDMRSKGRGHQKFTNEQVLQMRATPKTITMVRDLAKEWATSPGVMKRILNGQAYSWIENSIEVPPQFTGWRFTPEQVREILVELENPYWGQQTALAKKYGVHRTQINHIANNRRLYIETI